MSSNLKDFTATVTGPNKINQQIYLAALYTLPKVQIILGKFKDVQKLLVDLELLRVEAQVRVGKHCLTSRSS